MAEDGVAPSMPSEGGGSESIRVCLRIRPLPSDKEGQQFMEFPNPKSIIVNPPEYDDQAFIDGAGSILSDSYNFNFDQVFPPSASTLDVYNFLGVDVVGGVLNGYNSCLFVYGQTGSGKTHTMMGSGGIVGSSESSDEEEEVRLSEEQKTGLARGAKRRSDENMHTQLCNSFRSSLVTGPASQGPGQVRSYAADY